MGEKNGCHLPRASTIVIFVKNNYIKKERGAGNIMYIYMLSKIMLKKKGVASNLLVFDGREGMSKERGRGIVSKICFFSYCKIMILERGAEKGSE